MKCQNSKNTPKTYYKKKVIHNYDPSYDTGLHNYLSTYWTICHGIGNYTMTQ